MATTPQKAGLAKNMVDAQKRYEDSKESSTSTQVLTNAYSLVKAVADYLGIGIRITTADPAPVAIGADKISTPEGVAKLTK